MNIKVIFISIMMLFLCDVTAAKKIQLSKKFCSGIDRKILQIDKTLRAGYSLKKGEILKDKLRKLKQQKYACRMKRYTTK